jgi:hypothetical protein
MLRTLTIDSLGDLDNGRARGVVNDALEMIVDDMDMRGVEDGKPRKVTIEVTMTSDRGKISIDVQAKPTMPPYRTGDTHAKVRLRTVANKQVKELMFEDIAVDDPDQQTFRAMDDDGQK